MWAIWLLSELLEGEKPGRKMKPVLNLNGAQPAHFRSWPTAVLSSLFPSVLPQHVSMVLNIQALPFPLPAVGPMKIGDCSKCSPERCS